MPARAPSRSAARADAFADRFGISVMPDHRAFARRLGGGALLDLGGYPEEAVR
jgi:hypothetical protein